jgi:hypothetical protein
MQAEYISSWIANNNGEERTDERKAADSRRIYNELTKFADWMDCRGCGK